jgi:hypothetical protein
MSQIVLIKQKLMKNKRYILTILIIILTGMVQFPLKAQPPKGTPRPNFSGEWKAKESISMGGNIVCSYDTGDRMVSKTIKIVEHGDFITIDNPNLDAAAPLATIQEKLILDGKTRQIRHTQNNEKKCSVKLSNDGRTMTIHSIVYFMTATPYHVNEQMKAFTNVTELWNLSKDGKSISITAKATSNIWNEERSWETVFEKIN